MSIHIVYSDSDQARLREGQKKDPRIRASNMRPRPEPIGWDVRWRQNRSTEPASVRLLVKEGFDHQAAVAIDQKIKQTKRLNNGLAYRWMILGDRASEAGTPTLAEFALERFTAHTVAHLKPSTQRSSTGYPFRAMNDLLAHHRGSPSLETRPYETGATPPATFPERFKRRAPSTSGCACASPCSEPLCANR